MPLSETLVRPTLVDCVVLVGHGAAARDFPREKVSRLKALEGARRSRGLPPTDEELLLDREVRSWPRTPHNDPYAVGLSSLGEALRARLAGLQVVVAYNELCAPSLEDALVALLREGRRRIWIVSSMPTPGGVHAEVEIPETLEALRAEWPDASITYAWPFDAQLVAELFAAQLSLAGLALPALDAATVERALTEG